MRIQPALLSATFTLAQLGASLALAQDEDPFEASVALGYVSTTGNTETATLNSEILVIWRTVRWTHNGKFQSLGSQENEATTAERYYLEEKSDFSLSENDYLFLKGSYNDDRFSGYDYQAAVAGGYGHYFIRNDDFNLQAFGGAGYRESNALDTGREGEAILSLGESAEWRISDNAALVQSLTSDIGSEFSITRFELGLESNIIARIATKIAFQARHTSAVPAGNEKTDTQTSVSLVYSF